MSYMEQDELMEDPCQSANEDAGTTDVNEHDKIMQDLSHPSSQSSSSSHVFSDFSGTAAEIAALRRTDDEDPTIDEYIWEDERAFLGKTSRVYGDHRLSTSRLNSAADDPDSEGNAVEATDSMHRIKLWGSRMSLIGVVEEFASEQHLRIKLHPGRQTSVVDKERVLVIETPLGRPDWGLGSDEARLFRENWERYEEQGKQGSNYVQHVWEGQWPGLGVCSLASVHVTCDNRRSGN